jgi:hypothetical protein
MEIIRIVGCNDKIILQASKIYHWSKNGRFFLEGDAPTKNICCGMRLEHLGQFCQIRNNTDCYDMYTTAIYFNRDFSKFKHLYQKRLLAKENKEKDLELFSS